MLRERRSGPRSDLTRFLGGHGFSLAEHRGNSGVLTPEVTVGAAQRIYQRRSHCWYLRGFRLLNQRFLADHDDDAGVGDVETASVGFEVEADFGAFGQIDVAVDDGPANFRVPPDVHVVVQNAFTDVAIAVDAHVIADHTF